MAKEIAVENKVTEFTKTALNAVERELEYEKLALKEETL